jgi:hypothetical protein
MKNVLTIVLTAAVSSAATFALMRAVPDAHAAAPRQEPPSPCLHAPSGLAGFGAQDKEYRGEKFVLVDGKGEVKAVLATDKNGKPVFAMVDGNGKARISLAITKDDTPALGFTDSKDRAIIGLAVTDDDDAAFTLSDKKGKVQAALSVEGGTGKLHLNGEVHDK